MRTRRCALLLSLPLAATGSLLAHCFAYRLVEPDAHMRAHMLHESGHGYLTYAPRVFAGALALVLLALCAHAYDTYRGRAPRVAPPPWVFGALPPAGFVLQEHLERLVHTGSFALHAFVEPTFFVGLWLQVPFAAAAFLLARALLRVAERVGAALARVERARRPHTLVDALVPDSFDSPRIPVLARGRAQRGPPLLLPSA
jgi:hypothetical protein